MNIQAVSETPRFHALDGLRGAAAILVVLLHVEWRNHITGTRLVENGYLAVDLFFIISGLVIATNYAKRIIDIPTSLRFIGLRFFRLYPLHIVMLGVFFGLECCKLAVGHTVGITPEHQPFSGGMSYRSLIANIFLVHGLGWLRQPGWNGPSWSISCEFFAYLAFACATLLGLMRSRLFLFCGVILTVVAYVGIALIHGTLNVTLDLGVVRCFAGFFWGTVLAGCPNFLWLRSSQHTARADVPITAAVLFSMATLSGPMVVIVIPLFVVLIASLEAERGRIAHLLNSKPMQFLGRISYSIYMIHECVVVCVLMVLKRIGRMSFDPNIGRVVAAINPWLGDLLTLALLTAVVLLASQSYRLIEEPGRILGRRLLRSGRPSYHAEVPAARERVGRQVTSEVCQGQL
jgi:peptidoglycan/LPS O-acetylase OafA/YrhL